MNEILNTYKRTLITAGILLLLVILELMNWRDSVYGGLLPAFSWLQNSTPLGYVATNYGGIYAGVQAIHLLAMVLLGGTTLLMDLRLLNIAFTAIPLKAVLDSGYRGFKWGLTTAVLSGIFLASGVAEKVYYLQVFWVKMLALLVGSLFVIYFKMPLLRRTDIHNVWLLRALATSSLFIWFTVAATGRWIGFVG